MLADRDVPDSWRVKNADDIVTRVPSLLGYQHIGCEVSLFPHGKVSISGSSTDDVREGAVLTDLIPKIKSESLRLPFPPHCWPSCMRHCRMEHSGTVAAEYSSRYFRAKSPLSSALVSPLWLVL